MKLTDRQTHTVLAALRYWQTRTPAFEELDSIATNDGACEQLSSDEIHDLCEKINLGPRTVGEVVRDIRRRRVPV